MGRVLKKTETRVLRLSARIVGALFTLVLLLAAVPKLGAEVEEQGLWNFLKHVPETFLNWQESPEAFFYTFMLGYLLTWWKTGVGGVMLVALGIVPAVATGDMVTSVVFYGPAFLVGFLHLVYWFRLREEERNRRLELPPEADSQ